jgi:hypothetical protein
MGSDLVFSDGQRLDQSDLFPKAEHSASTQRLVVHKKNSTTMEIQNATDYDVKLLEQNGVMVSKWP